MPSAVTAPSTTRTPSAASSSACSALGGAVTEEDDVVAQLTEQLCHVHRPRPGGKHADRLVPHLPAVAIGAVENVMTPQLANARPVRQLVDQTRGDEQPSSTNCSAASQCHLE